jgi:hypothetical protein
LCVCEREHSDSKSIPIFLLSCTELSLCENNETHPTRATDQHGSRHENSNNSYPISHGRHKRGKRAGVLTRFRTRTQRPPLPTIFLSNVRSLKNKRDEHYYLMKTRRDFSDCSVYCFTDTWLYPLTPDSAVLHSGYTLHRADRFAGFFIYHFKEHCICYICICPIAFYYT